MTTDELNVMDNDNCIVFIRGLYPFFTKKYQLERHPNYKRTGDANKALLFNVKERFHTGENRVNLNEDRNKAAKLYRESQRADSRESERQHRMYTRPPASRRTSAGKPCLQPVPMTEMFPHVGVPVEQLTEQERIEREAAQADIVLEKVFVPEEEEVLAEYVEDMAEMADMGQVYSDFFAPDDVMEEAESFPADESVFDDMDDMERGDD